MGRYALEDEQVRRTYPSSSAVESPIEAERNYDNRKGNMMGKGEPYCTIDVPNRETAAYLMALVNPDIQHLCSNGPKYFVRDVVRTFQGGVSGLKAALQEIQKGDIWYQLETILLHTGCHYSEKSAPWRNPQAPEEIGGLTVTCRKAGLKVGCVEVSLEEQKLLLKKCEEAEE